MAIWSCGNDAVTNQRQRFPGQDISTVNKHQPVRGRTLRSASRAFIPPWSPAYCDGTVGSRTSQLLRARNPSRQRQEALRRSRLSREDVAIRVPPRIAAWSAGESRNCANACLAERHRNAAVHRGGAEMTAWGRLSCAIVRHCSQVGRFRGYIWCRPVDVQRRAGNHSGGLSDKDAACSAAGGDHARMKQHHAGTNDGEARREGARRKHEALKDRKNEEQAKRTHQRKLHRQNETR